jgi:hypothetical protein
LLLLLLFLLSNRKCIPLDFSLYYKNIPRRAGLNYSLWSPFDNQMFGEIEKIERALFLLRTSMVFRKERQMIAGTSE